MRDHERDEEAGAAASVGEPIAGTPRWVKAFGVIALVVVVLFVIVLLVRGGEHGPGRHSSGGAAAVPAHHTGPPSGVTREIQPRG